MTLISIMRQIEMEKQPTPTNPTRSANLFFFHDSQYPILVTNGICGRYPYFQKQIERTLDQYERRLYE